MKRPTKLLLGAATVWPVLYILCFIIGIFVMVLTQWSGGRLAQSAGESAPFPGGFVVLIIAHLSTMLLMVALLVYYMVDLFRTSRVPADMRTPWVLLLLLGGPLSMPVYWYLYVWREAPVSIGGAQGLTSQAASAAGASVDTTSPRRHTPS